MKRVTFILICITIISLLISGCSKGNRVEYIPYEITAPIVRCHGETDLQKLEYEKVIKGVHIGSEENQDIIQSNILKLKNAYKLLYSAAQCYERQIKKSEELRDSQMVEFNKLKKN